MQENSIDPGQSPRLAASEQGLCCLQYPKSVSSLKWAIWANRYVP